MSRGCKPSYPSREGPYSTEPFARWRVRQESAGGVSVSSTMLYVFADATCDLDGNWYRDFTDTDIDYGIAYQYQYISVLGTYFTLHDLAPKCKDYFIIIMNYYFIILYIIREEQLQQMSCQLMFGDVRRITPFNCLKMLNYSFRSLSIFWY